VMPYSNLKIDFGDKLTLRIDERFVTFNDARENNVKFLDKLKKAKESNH
jgi:hypothetical protein